jgi:hypothetical protein
LRYIESVALPKNNLLIDAGLRMRAAGELSFTEFAAIFDRVFDLETNFVEQIQLFNSAQIKIRYLLGL